MTKILVASYSFGGTTAQVARELAEALDADLDAIRDVVPRGPVEVFRGALESLARGLPAITHDVDPGDYDLVVLGCPVWGMSMASPMRSYLHAHRGALSAAACFCLYAGIGGHEATLEEMRALAGHPRAITMNVREQSVRRGRHRDRLDAFAARIRDAVDRGARPQPTV